MNKKLLIGLLFLTISVNFSIAQTVDLSSVVEFFKIASVLKNGREVTPEEWKYFESSAGYRNYAERENKTRINTIKSSLILVFRNNNANKDTISNIVNTPETDLRENPAMWLKKHILINYLEMNAHFDSIQSFSKNYDFKVYVGKAIQRLSLFLDEPIDSSFKFKTVYFHCMEADGSNVPEGLFIDLNRIYKITGQQRIDFLAHELFHNYREKYENHNFNYKSDLNFCIDMIQNEGIADIIDKSEGYRKYFTDAGETPEMVETWTSLYNQAQEDLERLQNVIMEYANGKISEVKLVDKIIEIVKYNGHSIGFFMANQIVKAGYKTEMIKTFYNPYEFFNLYNKASKKQNIFHLSDEFMGYLKDLTKEYYH